MTIPATYKRRAIIAHPIWGRGGAEAAAMWVIKALTGNFDVTVYTRGGFDLDGLNRLADTEISSSELEIVSADRANAWPLGALAHGAYLRSLRAVGANYNLRVTASGVAHWGYPAMHFISSAIWNDALATRFDAPNAPHHRSAAQAAAWRFAAVMSGERTRSLHEDLFVANSRWTAIQSAPFCPGSIEVVAPAVPVPESGLPWDERENGVLVFGRVSPEKHIEICISIIERLRKGGRPMRLCIAGPDGDPAYEAKIESLCRERADWVVRVPLVMGADKQRLLGRFRYGLSACEIEAFGIGTAEMAAAGIVVIAPVSGAQHEILKEPRQLYGSIDEAVQQFALLLDDDALQHRLHEQAIATREHFAPERFTRQVRTLAAQFVKDCRYNGAEIAGDIR